MHYPLTASTIWSDVGKFTVPEFVLSLMKI